MKYIILSAAIALTAIVTNAQVQPPQAVISNDILHAVFYLPDTTNGYYRATRFDWSGIMPKLEYNGHTYTGEWFPQYAPTINDAIMGPVESFGPLGYGNTPAGGSFVQVGVGALSKRDASPYTPFKYYAILNPGRWKTRISNNVITFTHELTDTGYSYKYTKTIALTKHKPELVLAHRMTNTGAKIIETDVFDHNFFYLDSTATGPGFALKFAFPLTATETRGPEGIASINGDSITIQKQLTGKESVYAVLHGYSNQSKDYDIKLENHLTGSGVHITADQPLSRLVYWGNPKALCPEPYIHIRVAPGETFTWTIRYEFYTNAK